MAIRLSTALAMMSVCLVCSQVSAQATEAATPKSETVTYLGITTKPVDDALRAQLSLPEDIGLIVTTVDRKGPAAGSIQPNDVLQKLDDQLLIDAHQLVALIHLHKPGDAVVLSIIRSGKPMTMTIKLGEKQRTVAAAPQPDFPAGTIPEPIDAPSPQELLAQSPFDLHPAQARGSQITMSFKDDLYTATVASDKNGHRLLTVKDTSNLVVAQGLVDTPAQWKKFSPDICKHLEVMRKMLFEGKPQP